MYYLNFLTQIPFALISFRLARKTMVVDALQGPRHEFWKGKTAVLPLRAAASSLF